MNAIKRNLSQTILGLLTRFPIVVIVGAHQVGKTTFAKQIAPDWTYVDLENPLTFERLHYDPGFFFEQHAEPLVIDGIQWYPALFDELQRLINEKSSKNKQLILVGACNAAWVKAAAGALYAHMAIVELNPLKANEYYQKPLSAFYDMLTRPLNSQDIKWTKPSLSLSQIQEVWLRGGYPQAVLQTKNTFYQQWMEEHRSTYIYRDVARLYPRLNQLAYQRFIYILSKLSGTKLNRCEIARAVDVSEGTIREYLKIACDTFMWRQLPSFEKNISKVILKLPKGHLHDTGLLHYLLRIASIEDLYQHPLVGASFESFVIEELIKGLTVLPGIEWNAYYYRTRNGSDIDLILEGPFGVLPIDIKYGETVEMKQLRVLTEFVKEHRLPMGILINQSKNMEWLTPTILQVPVGCL